MRAGSNTKMRWDKNVQKDKWCHVILFDRNSKDNTSSLQFILPALPFWDVAKNWLLSLSKEYLMQYLSKCPSSYKN